jgi:hypothetical protein
MAVTPKYFVFKMDDDARNDIAFSVILFYYRNEFSPRSKGGGATDTTDASINTRRIG